MQMRGSATGEAAPQTRTMLDTDSRTAWQLFHLNWFPILGMATLLALGLPSTGLSLEPVA
ncbi:hypothetical protein [Bradyrhizobium sp. ERR14]|nr:hypothetical protein [Bradyrhizobium sp. ERR14]MBB4396435.1 hypothetical protein [Bradyrhizobium sp. ERR14]